MLTSVEIYHVIGGHINHSIYISNLEKFGEAWRSRSKHFLFYNQGLLFETCDAVSRRENPSTTRRKCRENGPKYFEALFNPGKTKSENKHIEFKHFKHVQMNFQFMLSKDFLFKIIAYGCMLYFIYISLGSHDEGMC